MSNRRMRILWQVPAIAVLIGIAGYIFFYESAMFECAAVVHNSIVGPDGKTSIVVYERECGATVPFNTQASLSPTDREFSAKKTPSFLVIDGKYDLVVRWVSPRTVEVDVPNGARIFKKENYVAGITIEYR